jgi:hypothetical protein
MENYIVKEDINLLGKPVPAFPLGITETFDSLARMLPGGLKRNYYGLSHMEGGKIFYFAAAQEKFSGEAETYRCDFAVIEKGEYLVVPIREWRNHLESIKDVFHDLMQDQRIDQTKPCVEWYRSDEEMWCMVKVNKAIENSDQTKVQDRK